jgi:hypothetical protein
MALLSPGPETPVEDAASPYGTSAASPTIAAADAARCHHSLDLNTPHGEREQGEGSQRADVGQRPRRSARGRLGSRKRRSHPQERAAYTTSVAAPRSAESSVYASLAFLVARRCSRPEPSPARCFSIASLLTPPTATPRFGLPMLSGGPGVRVGSPSRFGTSVLLAPPQASVHKETGRDGGDRRRTAHDPTTAASPRLSEHDHGRYYKQSGRGWKR